MPALRHIAVTAKDPARMAEYYKTVFEMYEIRRSGQGAIFLSDGVVSLVLLPERGDGQINAPGPNHIGFVVEDVEATQERMRAVGADPTTSTPPRDGRYAEQFVRDPEGNRVDLAVAGWATVPAEASLAGGAAQTP